MISDTKIKILEMVKQPTTMKDLLKRSGLKKANLSLHVKDLLNKGYLMEVAKQGNAKVLQLNVFNISNYLMSEQAKLNEIKENVVG